MNRLRAGTETSYAMKRGRRLIGRVLTTVGTPIERARVLLGTQHNASGAPKANSDSDGRFVLENCEPGNNVVTVQAYGFSPDSREVAEDAPEGLGEFRLAKGRTLRVRIVDGAGDPIERARFSVESWHGHNTLDFFDGADDQGRVLWSSAPEDTVLCTVRATGYMQVSRQPLQASDEEHVITLSPELTISGSVTDATTGRPIPAFVVRRGFGSSFWSGIFWILNDETHCSDGTYEFKIDQQTHETHRLRVEVPGYCTMISRPFKPDEGAVTFDFALQPGADLVGTVLDAEGNPVAEAQIGLAGSGSCARLSDGHFERFQNQAQVVATDESGKFTLPPQGDKPFLLVVTHNSGYAEVTPEQFEQSAQIRLKPWGHVEGQVLLGDTPHANCVVSFHPQVPDDRTSALSYSHRAKTDAQGRFQLDRVRSGPGTIFRQLSIQYAEMTVGLGGWRQEIDVQSAGPTTVTIGGTGRPVVGHLELDHASDDAIDWTKDGLVTIQRWDFNTDLADEDTFKCYGMTDETGRVEIPDVLPGDYRLMCYFQSTFSGNRGSVKHDFTVGPMADTRSDEPLDLGVITVKVDDKP